MILRRVVTVEDIEVAPAPIAGGAVDGERVIERLKVTVDCAGPLDLPGIIAAIQRTKRLRKSRAKQTEAA